jgi:hypothetical protein
VPAATERDASVRNREKYRDGKEIPLETMAVSSI